MRSLARCPRPRPDLARPSASPLLAGSDGVADLSTALLCAAPLGVPRLLIPLGEVLSLHQSWDLFAPDPNREDGYWVIAGQLEGGQMVDVAGGGRPLNFEKPALPSQFYGGSRWLQYYLRVWEEAREPVELSHPTPLHWSAARAEHPTIPPYALRRTPAATPQARKPAGMQNTELFSGLVQWHCRRWEEDRVAWWRGEARPPPLEHIVLVFVRELTPPPGEPAPKGERLRVWGEPCGERRWAAAHAAAAAGQTARDDVPAGVGLDDAPDD